MKFLMQPILQLPPQIFLNDELHLSAAHHLTYAAATSQLPLPLTVPQSCP